MGQMEKRAEYFIVTNMSDAERKTAMLLHDGFCPKHSSVYEKHIFSLIKQEEIE